MTPRNHPLWFAFKGCPGSCPQSLTEHQDLETPKFDVSDSESIIYLATLRYKSQLAGAQQGMTQGIGTPKGTFVFWFFAGSFQLIPWLAMQQEHGGAQLPVSPPQRNAPHRA